MNWLEYYQERQEEMVSFLRELVLRESPSHDKQAVDTCSDWLISELKKMGLEVTIYPQKEIGQITSALLPLGETKAITLLLTHIDTVWPVGQLKEMPWRVDKAQNRIYGPGVLDMKAGLTQAVFALKGIVDLDLVPRNQILLFINSAEEIGSPAADELILEHARRSSIILCLEPALPGGGIKMRRKGRLVIELKVSGQRAHAGTPSKGVNAIEELALQLNRLRRLRTKSLTLNIGKIEGGEKANIVAAEAAALLDIRFWNKEQKNKVLTYLKNLAPQLPGAKLNWRIVTETPPLEPTEASRKLLTKVRRIASQLGLSLPAGRSGGGSDASLASQTGRPVLDGLGPEGEGIHAENENLWLPSLIQRTALLTATLLEGPL